MTSTLDVNVPALKDRVTNIITTPKTEWPVIEAEATTADKLYRSYIAPLAAIPAIAHFIGITMIGVSLPFVGTYRESIPTAFVSMILSFVLTLVGVYVSALVISKLAPTFESRPDDLQALKLVAYASTPSWIAGILGVIPVLSPLAIIGGLYAIYLFYVGLPVMMKTPEAKVIPYMVVAAVVAIAVYIVIGVLSATLTGVIF